MLLRVTFLLLPFYVERFSAVLGLLEETKKSCIHRQALYKYTASSTSVPTLRLQCEAMPML